MKVKTDPSGVVVIAPKGRLTGGSETDELKQEIERVVTEGITKCVIELSETIYLNSTALGLLVSAHKKFIDRGGKLKLSGVNKNIDNILVITKLSLVFEVFDTEAEALASFK
ncbi:STAS domain-containing protein [bacterium]|nr:STAS domain-containing protein [bacterium]NUN46569.1 STAS domain-containing protein [bacterium]